MAKGGAAQAGKKLWTDKEDLVVRECIAKGMMCREIATLLPGRTGPAVQRRSMVLGINVGREVGLQRFIAGHQKAKAEGRVGRKKGCQGRTPTPDELARRSAAMKLLHADPEFKQKHTERSKQGNLTRDLEAMKRNIRATKLAWCPEHLRADYRVLICKKHMRMAEARPAILELWRKQLRRALKDIASVALAEEAKPKNSFERQLERVRNGAKLVPKLKLSRSHDFSLTGNSSGMF